MSLKDLIEKVNDGDNVNALKKEFCHELEQLDNEEFMKAYNILTMFCFDDCCDCDDDWDYDDDDCDCDCDCNCDCCDCE